MYITVTDKLSLIARFEACFSLRTTEQASLVNVSHPNFHKYADQWGKYSDNPHEHVCCIFQKCERETMIIIFNSYKTVFKVAD